MWSLQALETNLGFPCWPLRWCQRPPGHVRFHFLWWRFISCISFSAKLDATENDLPTSVSFRINGFPTLKFKPAGSRDFIDYDGDRSLESLIAFIEEKAKNNLPPKVKAPEQEAQAMFAKPSEGQDELWFYLQDLCYGHLGNHIFVLQIEKDFLAIFSYTWFLIIVFHRE